MQCKNVNLYIAYHFDDMEYLTVKYLYISNHVDISPWICIPQNTIQASSNSTDDTEMK